MIQGIQQLLRPPRLGVIGLGIRVPNRGVPSPHTCQQQPCPECHPQEVPYFNLARAPELQRLWPNGRDEQGRELPGPTMLTNIRFPYDDVGRVLHDISYEKRAGKLLVIKCDGVECVEIPVQGQRRVVPCRKDPAQIHQPCACGARATAKLLIVVPQARIGVYQITLGGLQRIADLMSELGTFRGMFGDRLARIPFDLVRVPTQEHYQTKDGKRSTRTGYPVRIRCSITGEQALELAGGDLVRPLAALEPGQTVHEADVVGEGDDADEPWEIGTCYRVAQQLGISRALYDRYLHGQYGDDAELFGQLETCERETLRLRRAQADAGAAERLLADVTAIANRTPGRRR